MRLLVDRNADLAFARLLSDEGHDVAVVGIAVPQTAPDKGILGFALAGNCVAVTDDRDFGELVIRLQLPNPGVILCRLGRVAPADRLARFREALLRIPDPTGRLVVITESGIRVRE